MAYQAPSERSGVTGATPFDRADASGAAERIAHESLFTDFVTTLLTDSKRTVSTPAWGNTKHATAHYVVGEYFSGAATDAQLIELLAIVAQAAGPDMPTALRLRAQAWIATQARIYADWHAADAAEGMQ